MSGFAAAQIPSDVRASLRVLHRVEVDRRTGSVTLLVQSTQKPDWSRLGDYLLHGPGVGENPACKRIDRLYESITAGMVLAFRLRANPTKKVDTKSGPDGRRRNGRRVALSDEKAQIEWLRRKGEQGGFRLLAVRSAPHVPDVLATPSEKVVGTKRDEKGTRITFGAVLFNGELEVVDGDAFRRTLERGIGPGKAYGFGLLSVAPVGG